MAYIKSRKHAARNLPGSGRPAVALGLLLTAAPGLAGAQQAPAPAPAASAPQTLPPLRATGSAINELKPETASSPKFTAPLRDTPQTITVVPVRVLEEQNRLSLVEALSNVPGITFGAGEGGGGYGDNINFRGYSASNNITSDGLRDSAQYNRSDAFNIDRIEVSNGANSVYSGAGNVSGSINLVSKTPTAENAGRVSLGLGTDNYRRATADINRVLGETTALRLNLMAHGNDVPGRDVEKFERWGVAPSIAFGLNTPTRVTLSYFHQRDDNIPQYGVPYYKTAVNDGPLPGVDPGNYYGYANVDKQEIEVDTFTAMIDHDFGNGFSVRNMTRGQRVKQFTVVDPPQGTWCLANGLTPAGGPCVTTTVPPITVPAGQYLPSGPRGNTRDTTNTLLANQTDFTTKFTTGTVEHTLVTGFTLTHEKFELDNYNVLRNADGTSPYTTAPNHYPFMDIADPDNTYDGPYNQTLTGKTRGDLDNAAVYAFDTLKLNEQWQINGGVRWERNSGSTTANTALDTAAPVFGTPADSSEKLLSYRIGLVFKPAPNGSVYVAYGNSETPSKASVNGSCTNNSTAGGNNCTVDPEKAVNIEIGTKWDVLDNRLALTASVFRNELENYKVTAFDPALPDFQVLDGRSRVDGATLGAAGQLTREWDLFANYTYLDSKVIQGASDYCLANPTDPDCVTALASAPQAGNPLTNVPQHAFSLWTTYRILPSLTLGYGATYQGSWYLNNNPGTLFKAPSYWVHNAMLAWRATRNLDLQLNLKNLANEEYYTRIRNNGWAVPGDTRAAVLSASYAF
jgi:catecholate siderophore receptor